MYLVVNPSLTQSNQRSLKLTPPIQTHPALLPQPWHDDYSIYKRKEDDEEMKEKKGSIDVVDRSIDTIVVSPTTAEELACFSKFFQ